MSAPVNLVSFREFARLDGCSDKLVRNAVKAGKLPVTADNRIDAALAGSGWRQQNRRAAESADSGADKPPVSALSPADADVSAGSIQIDDFLANFIAGRMLSRADAERVKENGAAAKNLLAAMQEAGDVIDIAIAEAMGDAIMYGRSVEGFVVAHRVGGKKVQSASALLTGYTQIAGAVSAEPDAVRFIGATPDAIGVDQCISIDGKRILIDVGLTNRTGAELVDLRYMRLIDFDQPGAFETVNEVVERGRARATMAGDRVLTVGSDDPRATIGLAVAVPPTLDPYAIKALPVGTKRKGDDSIHVCFDIGTLAIGASTRLRIVIDGSAIAS